MENKIFSRTGGKKPGYNKFDLSNVKLFTGDMGVLYPVYAKMFIPGSVVKVSNKCVIRFQPMVAPIMHEIEARIDWFACPLRLLMGSLDEDDWQNFITGGSDGADSTTLDRWSDYITYGGSANETDIGSLWDHFGYQPTGTPGTNIDASGADPLAFDVNMYNKVWNEWYRDELLQTERTYDDVTLANINNEKNYFTAARTAAQLGTAPVLSLSGSTNAVWPSVLASAQTTAYYAATAGGHPYDLGTKTFVENNTVDFSGATFPLTELRTNEAILEDQELNMRAGVRLEEWLYNHFGVSPGNYALQESQFLGRMRQPIIVSEVLQTSEDGTTPQGNLAGHGISVNRGYVAKYRCKEHIMLMGLLSLRPKHILQTGHKKESLYETRYDFPNPIFANIGEQEVITGELFVTDGNVTANETIFGYIGRFDECRYERSFVSGDMRSDFDFWTITDQLTTAPTLNSAFITCDPRKDFLAATSEDTFMCQVGNLVKAVIPLPFMSNPSLMPGV